MFDEKTVGGFFLDTHNSVIWWTSGFVPYSGCPRNNGLHHLEGCDEEVLPSTTGTTWRIGKALTSSLKRSSAGRSSLCCIYWPFVSWYNIHGQAGVLACVMHWPFNSLMSVWRNKRTEVSLIRRARAVFVFQTKSTLETVKSSHSFHFMSFTFTLASLVFYCIGYHVFPCVNDWQKMYSLFCSNSPRTV